MPVLVAAIMSCLVLASVPQGASASALEEDGTRFEQLGKTTFWWKSILKVYDISCHVGTGHTAADILSDVPMRLELRYHRGFTAADIIKGGDDLLRQNVSAATMETLAARLAELNRAYIDVKAGDAYTLTYVPGRGTSLRYNGKVLTTIPGSDFASAYFRIWLGKKPMSAAVRDELLGR